jgi:peptide/nickel transport system permease protein
MTAYIVRRVALMVPVALLVSFVTFMLIHLVPGDPARTILGPEASPESVVALDQQLGLDKPLWTQYGIWLNDAIHGNLGASIALHQPVTQAIAQRLPVTLELGIASLLFSLVLAVPLGVLAATRRGSRTDWLVNVMTLLGTTVPTFVLGLLLILILAVLARPVFGGFFPPGGYIPFGDDPADNLRHLILPMLALASGAVAGNLRQVRASMLEVLGQDYIRTARAKGLATRIVNYRHALPNALLPVITLVGLQTGGILAGAVIIETIFLWPGIGQLGVNSIFSKDYPVVQGTVLLAALSYMVINLVVDITYALVDPRISYGTRR